MQNTQTDTLASNCNISEPKSIDSNCDDESTEEDIENQNMLLKAHYFSKIGMGSKPIQSMSHEKQRKMTTYFKEKVVQKEEEPVPNETPSAQDQSEPEEGVSIECLSECVVGKGCQNAEEWVKRSLINKNMIHKAQLLARMGMGPQSLDSMTPNTKARLTHYCKEQFDEQESCQEPFTEEDLIVDPQMNREADFSMDFVLKTDDEARNCYYDKLVQMKVLKLTPSKKNQSIIIFDWDDTLLCTTYLVALGIRGVAPSVVSVLKPVDGFASQLLDKSTDSGQVYIITNAEQGWVQYSAQVFLPETFKVMQKKNVIVISARSCYQEMFPGDTHRWKKEAFASLMKDFEKDIITNLICIGDSHIEMDAAHCLAKQFDKAIIKTIKFKENPKPEELAKQQFLVLERFDQIFVSLRNTAIKLEKKSI